MDLWRNQSLGMSLPLDRERERERVVEQEEAESSRTCVRGIPLGLTSYIKYCSQYLIEVV